MVAHALASRFFWILLAAMSATPMAALAQHDIGAEVKCRAALSPLDTSIGKLAERLARAALIEDMNLKNTNLKIITAEIQALARSHGSQVWSEVERHVAGLQGKLFSQRATDIEAQRLQRENEDQISKWTRFRIFANWKPNELRQSLVGLKTNRLILIYKENAEIFDLTSRQSQAKKLDLSEWNEFAGRGSSSFYLSPDEKFLLSNQVPSPKSDKQTKYVDYAIELDTNRLHGFSLPQLPFNSVSIATLPDMTHLLLLDSHAYLRRLTGELKPIQELDNRFAPFYPRVTFDGKYVLVFDSQGVLNKIFDRRSETFLEMSLGSIYIHYFTYDAVNERVYSQRPETHSFGRSSYLALDLKNRKKSKFRFDFRQEYAPVISGDGKTIIWREDRSLEENQQLGSIQKLIQRLSGRPSRLEAPLKRIKIIDAATGKELPLPEEWRSTDIKFYGVQPGGSLIILSKGGPAEKKIEFFIYDTQTGRTEVIPMSDWLWEFNSVQPSQQMISPDRKSIFFFDTFKNSKLREIY